MNEDICDFSQMSSFFICSEFALLLSSSTSWSIWHVRSGHIPVQMDVRHLWNKGIIIMANNATFYNVREVFAVLDGTLARLGVPLKASMEKIFCENMR